jgi:hypothetical protein
MLGKAFALKSSVAPKEFDLPQKKSCCRHGMVNGSRLRYHPPLAADG